MFFFVYMKSTKLDSFLSSMNKKSIVWVANTLYGKKLISFVISGAFFAIIFFTLSTKLYITCSLSQISIIFILFYAVVWTHYPKRPCWLAIDKKNCVQQWRHQWINDLALTTNSININSNYWIACFYKFEIKNHPADDNVSKKPTIFRTFL